MTLYYPVYNPVSNTWTVETVEASSLRRMGAGHADRLEDSYTRFKDGFGRFGAILNANTLFISESAAWRYIRGECWDFRSVWNGGAGV